MKKKILYSFVIIVLLILLLFVLLRHDKARIASDSPIEEAQSPNLVKVAEEETPELIKRLKEKLQRGIKLTHRQEYLLNYYQIRSETNVPVIFYGKVVDQNGEPVVGARVNTRFSGYNLSLIKKVLDEIVSPEGVDSNAHLRIEYPELITDEKGNFEFFDNSGYTFAVKKIEKEGYLFHKSKSFLYGESFNDSAHQPDPNKPVVFEMWKKGETEELVKYERFYGIIPDNSTHYIDLLTASKTLILDEKDNSTADILIKMFRPKSASHKEPFDWSFSINVVGGGIQASSDEFLFLAPSEGYSKSVFQKYDKNDQSWSKEISKKFYVKSRSGAVYASLIVNLISLYNNESVFEVEWLANPNGSRNLEYDPEKDVTDQYRK